MQTTTTFTERWAKAQQRAIQYGATPKQIATDRFAVKSSSRNIWFMVQSGPQGMTCTCEAGIKGDPICWHRAAACMAAQTTRTTTRTPKTAA